MGVVKAPCGTALVRGVTPHDALNLACLLHPHPASTLTSTLESELELDFELAVTEMPALIVVFTFIVSPSHFCH